MLRLECNACFTEYDADTSDALLRHMYCSKECEDAEDSRLKEANSIMDSAIKNNPSLLEDHRVKLQEIGFKNMGLGDLVKFTKKEIEEK